MQRGNARIVNSNAEDIFECQTTPALHHQTSRKLRASKLKKLRMTLRVSGRVLSRPLQMHPGALLAAMELQKNLAKQKQMPRI